MKKLYSTLFFLTCFLSFFTATEGKQTICLNMIVKDEAHVITRCLKSVLPIIDSWVIVDTGSTDGTQDVIRNYMESMGIPGQLYERPWEDFGHNRTEALKLAKGVSDYLLIIDADEVLEFDNDFTLPELSRDFYYIMSHLNGTVYARMQLINQSRLDWEWVGVVHELLVCPQARTVKVLEGVKNIITFDGARSKDALKFYHDALKLEKALIENPTSARDVFYLAQSYKDAGMFERAIENYQRRVPMGGFIEEAFWSLYQIGVLQEALGMPYEVYSESYLKAFSYRPSRVEPLHNLLTALRGLRNFEDGYQVGLVAINIPLSHDLLLVESWKYEYDVLLQHSVCAYEIGKYEECKQACLKLLANPKLPPHVRETVERNLSFTNAKILEEKILRRNQPKA